MKFLKSEFARQFAFGFAGGAHAIVAITRGDLGSRIAGEVVPAAIAAAPTR